MFFFVELWKNISLSPNQLGPRYDEHIDDILRSQVEGQWITSFGYVVCVVRILLRQPGRIQDGTGLIIVPIKYQAIVYRPMKGEVIDGTVESVNELGIIVNCGPLKRVFVSQSALPENISYSSGVDGSTARAYLDSKSQLQIKQNTEVRVRLRGVNHETLSAVAEMNSDYLGPVEDS
ncbi:DNA-directed RNA polymerase II subunit RPB7, putative [Cryptosporidium muris RN66]|uniref:DNA-directed RNA polymerase II subunit RPB7, putative n=1 Tax=Cryptosporidium muris (strain RN66) TaxID=441375 RepID=B6AK20_CRYMR|nr:DNA-directed RNA polymerase II subunit RPB7, putative [Cryptosporidium muris RN66]EEA08561.1 DNA-directed RNA polymerase II subunit RPB7, putative [Cryptosporidium muris RN66]|eukprot:XP_002142910.1 DNA-directed RNA polymerase II subunit RPB7 [Cryptosporidium muris RN66]